MKLQQALSRLRKAVDDFNMINEGDRIVVGLSGGKDSTLMLVLLAHLKRFYPKKFELYAATITMDEQNYDLSSMEALCKELDVPYTIYPSNLQYILFEERKEKNPCSLCANLRRGILHSLAIELGCNKIALGHHADDALETFFMSLFKEGRMNCFLPVTHFSRRDLYGIRPMLYMWEWEVRAAGKKIDLPIIKNNCPANGKTNRQQTKEFISELEKNDRGVKTRMFSALKNGPIWNPPQNNLK